MNRRRALVGLSVLCALALSAFTASAASATAPTTAGECVSGGGKKDFSDAHCDNAVAENKGTFGHVLFANGTPVEVTATNDLTGTASNVTLEGKIAGVVTNVKCTTGSGTGTVTNGAGGTVTFGTSTTSFSGCTVEEKPAACKGTPVAVASTVANETGPTDLKISTATKTGPTGEAVTFHEENTTSGKEMGLKFEPTTSGGNFTTLTFEASCGIGTTPVPVKGFAYATPGRGGSATSTGATAIFSKSSTIGGLTAGGNPAYFEATFTFRKKGGNPLIITTTE